MEKLNAIQKEKLDLVIDKLIVKTQDGLCQWKLKNDTQLKYSLVFTAIGTTVELYEEIIIGGDHDRYLQLYVYNGNNIIMFGISSILKDNDNINRLYVVVKAYHNELMSKHIEQLITEINKM